MSETRILVVEDDPALAEALRRELEQAYTTVVVHRGGEAIDAARATSFDLVLLDLNLPDLDGLDVAEAISGTGPDIIMLTARSDVPSRVRGLYAGASDYVAKPFDMDELLARIFVRLRARMPTSEVRRGELAIMPNDLRCRVGDHSVDLTPQEQRILLLLLTQQDRVHSKPTLVAHLAEDAPIGDNAIEAVVSRLRRKLARAGAKDVIDTVRGLGYVVRSIDE